MSSTRIVVSQLCVEKWTALQLDSEIPQIPFSKYLIDGISYVAVPVYDLPRHIAIEATGEFVGKTVEFV